MSISTSVRDGGIPVSSLAVAGRQRPVEPPQGEGLLKEPVRLTSHLRLKSVGKDRVVVANHLTKTSMVLDHRLARVLSYFSVGEAPVQDVFPQLVRDRVCPPLNDLYELILLARERQILVAPGESEEPQRSFKLPFKLHGDRVRGLLMAGIVAGVAAFALTPLQLPSGWLTVLAAYAIVVSLLTLGNVLGACVLAAHRCEVFRPRLRLNCLFPHLIFSYDEIRLVGLREERDVAIARVFPLCVGLGFASLWAPGMALVMGIATLLQAIPVDGSAMKQLLRGGFNVRTPSIYKSRLFPGNAGWRARTRAFFKRQSLRLLLLEVLFGAAWTAVAVVWALGLRELFRGQPLWQMGAEQWFVTFSPVLLAGCIGLCVTVVVRSILRVRSERERMQECLAFEEPFEFSHRHHGVHREIATRLSETGEIPLDLLGQLDLFHGISERGLSRLTEFMFVEEYGARERISDDESLGDRVLILFWGRVQVERRRSDGSKVLGRTVQPGQIVDLVGVLTGQPETMELTALEHCYFLSFNRANFFRYFVPLIGLRRLYRLLVRDRYFEQMEVFGDWPREALEFLIDHSSLKKAARNEDIIEQGSDNVWFVIVLEGSCAVKRDGKHIGMLEPGEFYGELNVLQNSLSDATVTALEGSVCLLLSNRHILELMAMDHRLALFFEHVASMRIGRSIFPLQGNRFSNFATVFDD